MYFTSSAIFRLYRSQVPTHIFSRFLNFDPSKNIHSSTSIFGADHVVGGGGGDDGDECKKVFIFRLDDSLARFYLERYTMCSPSRGRWWRGRLRPHRRLSAASFAHDQHGKRSKQNVGTSPEHFKVIIAFSSLPL